MDRISGLPDEVLCHILSFLPTKLAALTSVLSTRWRKLLAFVPNLDITSDDKMVYLDRASSYELHCEILRKGDNYVTMRSFRGFIDRVLALQGDSSIKKVSLKCRNHIHPDHLDRWICNVLRRGVSDLEIFVYDEDCDVDFNYFMPQEMFVSRTLVNLKLRNVKWWPGAEGTFLPKLKTLVVKEHWFCSDKLEMILPAFPVLEELYTEMILWKPWGDTVSSASLKKLTIHAMGCESKIRHSPTSMSISFDTPSLLYLEYSDEVANYYPKVNMPNLVEAVLDLEVCDYMGREPNNDGDTVLRCENLWKLMSGIRNLQKLTFSSKTLKLFSLCIESMPVFNNLKMLRISRSYDSVGWQAMPVLLNNCPHLETLHIEDFCIWDCISLEEKGGWLIPCPVEKIQIEMFRGTKGETGMLKHLLESFPCLKEMEICTEKDNPTDIFDLVVKMVNLYNESYRVVVCASRCVILPIYELDS